MLTAIDLDLALGGRIVVSGVDAEFCPGELTIFVGPNGAGKTTLLRALSGALAPARGAIVLDGRSIASWDRRILARRRAVLSQSGRVNFPFTVCEVVGLGLTAAGRLKAEDRGALVADALAKVDLAEFGERLFQELSGGEQQRVQIARVLCQLAAARWLARESVEPQWLFLDEPTSSLDVSHQLQILDVARAHAEAGGGAVAVLHDLNLAMIYADRVLMLSRGKVVADGAPAAVFTDGLVRDVFSRRLRVVEGAGGRYVMPEALPSGATGSAFPL